MACAMLFFATNCTNYTDYFNSLRELVCHGDAELSNNISKN